MLARLPLQLRQLLVGRIQLRELLPLLKAFVETGSIGSGEPGDGGVG